MKHIPALNKRINESIGAPSNYLPDAQSIAVLGGCKLQNPADDSLVGSSELSLPRYLRPAEKRQMLDESKLPN